MGTDIHGRLQYRYNNDDAWEDGGEMERGRNYHVFAMLADVRNGLGFAGVETHKPIDPISEPRGYPSDLTVDEDEVSLKLWGNDPDIKYWMGDHSHSWLTIKEVIEWPGWDKPIHMVGYVTADEKSRLDREGGTPNEWCGETNNPSYVRIEWEVPFVYYAKVFKAWIDYITLKHAWLIKKDPSLVRIVFGFDS